MRIAMLLHKSVVHDSRVRREAKALTADGHEVTILELAPVGPGAEEFDGARRRSVLPPSWVRRAFPLQLYRFAFAATFVREILAERPDVIHGHDAAMLLPALIGRRLTGAQLVYDSHELATGVPYRDRRWAAFVRAIERIGLPRCAAVITVSDGIAQRLQELYDLPQTPAVVRNVPDAPEEPPRREGRLRAALGIDDVVPLVLHQGSAAANRGVDVVVRAMAHVPHAHLVLLGPGGDEWPPLREIAAAAGVADRVHMLPPVPVDELLLWTADADVGVSLLQDTCDNHRLALPNKVFEYVAAGLPVVVSDLPELRRLVTVNMLGWAVDGSDSSVVAGALEAATAGRSEARIDRAVAPPALQLRWAVEKGHLTEVYGRMGRRGEERLSRTYAAYAASLGKQRAWASTLPANQAIRRELLDQLMKVARGHIDAGARILDLGCGTGWLLRALTDRGVEPQRLTGVEILPDRVAQARNRAPGANVVEGNAAALPFGGESFGVVLLAMILSSIVSQSQRESVLREAARVVRPDGVILLYDTRVPNFRNTATRRLSLREIEAASLEILSVTTLTVLPPLVRRIPNPMRSYCALSAVPVLRTHRLVVARRR